MIPETWERGFDAYFRGILRSDCPNYSDQESRDEWVEGWNSAECASDWCPKEKVLEPL